SLDAPGRRCVLDPLVSRGAAPTGTYPLSLPTLFRSPVNVRFFRGGRTECARATSMEKRRLVEAIEDGNVSTLFHARSTSTFSSRSEEHTSELQSRRDLVCRLLLDKKKLQARRRPLAR